MDRTIKIGNARVGLIGIEASLQKLKKEIDSGGNLSTGEALKRLFDAVKERNYVPPNAEKAYLDALKKLWLKETGQGQDMDYDDDLRIRILGPGCVSCNRLEEMVLEVMAARGIAADIEHVRELDEIWRYGVIQTPALVVGKKVLCSGKMPMKAQVEAWFNELFHKDRPPNY